jgi:predicted nucleic acid-binding protein
VAKPAVYLEASVISYLVRRLNPSDLTIAHHQMRTREWWSSRRDQFELFVSAFVVSEAGTGDPALAAQRSKALEGLPVLETKPSVHELADQLLARTGLPAKAAIDALHLASAAVHGMDYLLTWNCKHIANGVILPGVYNVCRAAGYEPPFVCTPLELLE